MGKWVSQEVSAMLNAHPLASLIILSYSIFWCLLSLWCPSTEVSQGSMFRSLVCFFSFHKWSCWMSQSFIYHVPSVCSSLLPLYLQAGSVSLQIWIFNCLPDIATWICTPTYLSQVDSWVCNPISSPSQSSLLPTSVNGKSFDWRRRLGHHPWLLSLTTPSSVLGPSLWL